MRNKGLRAIWLLLWFLSAFLFTSAFIIENAFPYPNDFEPATAGNAPYSGWSVYNYTDQAKWTRTGVDYIRPGYYTVVVRAYESGRMYFSCVVYHPTTPQTSGEAFLNGTNAITVGGWYSDYSTAIDTQTRIMFSFLEIPTLWTYQHGGGGDTVPITPATVIEPTPISRNMWIPQDYGNALIGLAIAICFMTAWAVHL